MPAKSRKQQQMMAIAEHEPGKLYGRNKGVLSMSQEQLHDFAATKNAPKKKAKPEANGHSYDFRKQTGKKAPKRISKLN